MRDRSPGEVTDTVAAASRGTYVVFAGAGFAVATWASRIPQVRSQLHLTPATLGLVLFAIALGSILALPLAGPVVARIGSRKAVAVMGVVLALALGVVSIGYLVGLSLLVLGLFVFGLANGVWDVAMNVQAAAVERHAGRSLMPRFHAAFSLGTVAGALVGVGMVALPISVSVHFGVVAVLVLIIVPMASRAFVADYDARPEVTAANTEADSSPVRRGAMAAWFERRTVLVGVVVLGFGVAEGAGGDWIGVSVIDHHHASPAVGTLAYAVFVAAMTTMRWFGSTLLDRFGRVVVLRCLAAIATAGVVVFVFSPNIPVALLGATMWGLGAALGFPVGMSAGADDPHHAAGRVGVIASIGYCAFLGGPPLIGFVGSHVTVDSALLVVTAFLGIACGLAGATQPVPRDSARSTK